MKINELLSLTTIMEQSSDTASHRQVISRVIGIPENRNEAASQRTERTE